MTKKKLPESHESHTNSDISYKNLRDVLPAHWKIVPIRDDKSGNEYGQDWLIQMTNEENQVSAEEFRVQSKVISRRTSKRRIGSPIKISTLNYLSEIPIPVMLHFYDNVAECGYWMWLEGWYSEHYSSRLESKSDVSVYIPKKNKFDETTIKQLRSKVQFTFHRMNLLKKADVATALDQDFAYRTSFDANSITVGIYAKHNNVRPLSFRMELNEEADKTFQKVFERGEAVSFEGAIYQEGELPDFLGSNDGLKEITVIPHTPDKSFPARMEFLDNDQNQSYRIPYVLFHLVRDGSHYKRWEALEASEILLCILEENPVELITHLQVRRNRNNKTLKALSTFLDFRKRTANSKNIQFTSLVTDKITLFPVPKQEISGLSPEGMIWDRFVQALTTIEGKIHIPFDLPVQLSGKLLSLTEFAAEVVSTGRTSKRFGLMLQVWDDKVLIGTSDKATAQNLVQRLTETGNATCFFSDSEPLIIELLSHQIDLSQ